MVFHITAMSSFAGAFGYLGYPVYKHGAYSNKLVEI